MQLYLGVDGGNSKTVALVACTDGNITGCGRAGCSDIYGAPSAESALRAIEEAVRSALRPSCNGLTVQAGVFSLAGADWEEDFNYLHDQLIQRLPVERLTVVNDAMGALRAGTEDGYGVSVVCGTGAAIGAKSRTGRVWHSSWWQEPQGSKELAWKSMKAVYRSALGTGPATSLSDRVLGIFDLPDVESILHATTRRESPVPLPHAAITVALLACAREGDEVAADITRSHGAALGEYAAAAARCVGIDGQEYPLVLAGGVLRHAGPLLSEPLIERVRERSGWARPVESRWEPVVGALLLAAEEGVSPVTPKFICNLTATMPAVDLLRSQPVL